MQKEHQQKFDSIIKQRIKEEGLERPSMNFTNSVIGKIGVQKEDNHLLDYKPLISKKVWYVAAILLLCVFSFLMYSNTLGFNTFPDVIAQQFKKLNLIERIPNPSISSIYVYAFIGLAFFAGVQVYLLKAHFDKRYYLD
jgi:hypothetical protein